MRRARLDPTGLRTHLTPMRKKKTPEPENLTAELLKQIRDGVGRLEGRIDATRAELVAAIGQTNDRLDRLAARLEALEQRLTATDLRLSTQHTAILGALEELRTMLADGFARDAAINDLSERVEVLEQKAGLRQ